jgi:hypothetical protein
MRSIANKKIAAVAAGALVVATAGAAYAYWTTSGSGSGSATTAGSNGTLVLDGVTVSGLTPGQTQTMNVTATNNSSTTLAASSLTVSSVTSDQPDCLALVEGAKPTFVPNNPSSQVVVAPGGGSAAFGTVTVSLPNSSTLNQDVCKSATFTVNLAAS